MKNNTSLIGPHICLFISHSLPSLIYLVLSFSDSWKSLQITQMAKPEFIHLLCHWPHTHFLMAVLQKELEGNMVELWENKLTF